MTLIGKFLVYLNLVIGIGVAVVSTAVYTERPTWFDAPEGGDKGPVTPGFTFAQMKGETDNLGRAVITANKSWGEAREALEAAEKTRDDRRAKFDARLVEAHKTGIFELKRDPETKMVSADDKGPAVIGPDGDPLRGADPLLDLPGGIISDKTKGIAELVNQIAKLRAELTAKIDERDLLESQRRKQVAIRETVLNELYFLRDFGINRDEERDTVLRRKRQLDARLMQLSK